jgi:hypothetical protein
VPRTAGRGRHRVHRARQPSPHLVRQVERQPAPARTARHGIPDWLDLCFVIDKTLLRGVPQVKNLVDVNSTFEKIAPSQIQWLRGFFAALSGRQHKQYAAGGDLK